ncbi:MAG: hypothetical protein KKB59_19345 [Spirochaetes bacterium]|nr:hypothetical protein [Spirochaetota bacterium]
MEKILKISGNNDLPCSSRNVHGSVYDSITFDLINRETKKMLSYETGCKDAFSSSLGHALVKNLRRNMSINFYVSTSSTVEIIENRIKTYINILELIEKNWKGTRKSCVERIKLTSIANSVSGNKRISVLLTIRPNYVWLYGYPLTTMFLLIGRIMLSNLKNKKTITMPKTITRTSLQKILSNFVSNSDKWFVSSRSKKINMIIEKANKMWGAAKSDRPRYFKNTNSHSGISSFIHGENENSTFIQAFKGKEPVTTNKSVPQDTINVQP